MSCCKLTHDFCSPEVRCAGVIRQAKDRSGSLVPQTECLVGIHMACRLLSGDCVPKAQFAQPSSCRLMGV